MVSIHVEGKDRTVEIFDWAISWNDKEQKLELKCFFRSTKTYTWPLSACCVAPTEELGGVLLTKRSSMVVKPVEQVTIYGRRYAAVRYTANGRPYIYKLDNVDFMSQTATKDTAVFRYLVAVAKARMDRALPGKRPIAQNIVRQMDALTCSPGTALHAYCIGKTETRLAQSALIFPFGVNESQLAAVERAFAAQVSVIEGPPGTGKTQTILNILANILLQGKTVAILSNNNPAVENVYEKLEKADLGHLVAKLGSQGNRKEFFANLPLQPFTEPEATESMDEIQATLVKVKQLLRDHNMEAQLHAEIDELTIERNYLQQWHDENARPANVSLDKYGLSPSKTVDLMVYLAHLGTQRLRIRDRIDLVLNFRIFRAKPFANEARSSVFHALQMHYYDKALREKEAALQACRESLATGNFEALLQSLTMASMRYLKQYLGARSSSSFDEKTYKNVFDAFMQRFPIIGSSTHSIVNSIAAGAILDYVIIDEASQQDIMPGVLALGCSKNVIVVGDSRQLAHIATPLGLQAPADFYDCDRYSLLDSCIGVFKDSLPRTLLREHYRCHPRIIGFCNQQFYDNALVPMNRSDGDEPLRMIVTAKGNHTRKNTNLRELDSILAVLTKDADAVSLHKDGRGFISPYRAQVELANLHLQAEFVKNTVHKFQGRECDEIVFSTVLDKKLYNQDQRRINFVDDARMINVAVSRAKNRFTLVTGDDVFTANNGHVAALMRYVEYYAQDAQIVRAPVVSAFDLLYKEYDQSLERLRASLRLEDSRYRSEQIVAHLLRKALSDASRQALTFHAQVLLNQVASAANPALTEQELTLMRNRASCDFVLYFKVGKVPVGVIEVDGGSHETKEQSARDALKNSILEKSRLRILRLRTKESGIEEKIDAFLARWATPVTAEIVPSPDA